jgi:hypothetical protein
MKKGLLQSVLVLFFGILIASCSNDVEESSLENSLPERDLYEGTWIFDAKNSSVSNTTLPGSFTLVVSNKNLERFIDGRSIKNSASDEDCTIANPKLAQTVVSCIGERDANLEYLNGNSISLKTNKEELYFSR